MSNIFSSGNNETVPKILTDVAEFLNAKGHLCVQIIGINDYELKWCQKDFCVISEEECKTKEINHEQMEFAGKLADEGHKCISYTDSYPVEIGWCNETPCKDVSQ